MRHSNHVVKLYDSFDMEDHNILVMEHPGTSMTLCDFIKENEGRLTEAVAKDIMQKLIAAFRLCSERGVYYKDMSLSKVLIDPVTMQIKLTGFYRALTIFETQTAKSKSALVRRFHALFATNEGLYRVLKGMVEANSLKLWFGWKNTRLSKECQDLLRKLRDRESEITLQNILDHDWFKKTPGTDALESDGNMQFEGMDSSSAQPSSRSPTDVPAQNDPTVTLRFPRQPILQHKYFRCLYKVGKKVGYDDRVHEGIRRSDGQKVAIKFVERCRLWETSPKFVEEGTSLLKMQKRPTCDHSVRLYERFILEDQTVLVMEHLPAYVTLREFIRGNGGCLTDETANRIMSQIHVAIRHWTDNDLSYPLLKRLILINPKTLHIKYAHLAEKEFSSELAF
ncbi:serine/threonine-protein kinase pim-3-like [Siphateles boraxobius]|uniref:serine/threonine-protein kinase pim-3-like n=1 Tax=Siphateles boraxobius TaxID=180520 RepID=UPI004064C3DD